jgi:hypothetical protein
MSSPFGHVQSRRSADGEASEGAVELIELGCS